MLNSVCDMEGAWDSRYFFAAIPATAVAGFHADSIAPNPRSCKPMKLFFSSWLIARSRPSLMVIDARSSSFMFLTSIPYFSAAFCRSSLRPRLISASASFSIPVRIHPCDV